MHCKTGPIHCVSFTLYPQSSLVRNIFANGRLSWSVLGAVFKSYLGRTDHNTDKYEGDMTSAVFLSLARTNTDTEFMCSLTPPSILTPNISTLSIETTFAVGFLIARLPLKFNEVDCCITYQPRNKVSTVSKTIARGASSRGSILPLSSFFLLRACAVCGRSMRT